MRPPNIPLRAGPSGPLVDLAYYLYNLNGFIAPKRLWYVEQSGVVSVPKSTAATPGVEVLSIDVEWSSADAARTSQLAYGAWAFFAGQSPTQPAGYPSVLVGNLNAQPAGGALTTPQSWTMSVIPLNFGVDFTFRSDLTGVWLGKFGDFDDFVEGTNRFALGLGNPDPTQDVDAVSCSLLIAEFVSIPTAIYTG